MFNLPSGIVGAGLALQVFLRNTPCSDLIKVLKGGGDEENGEPEQAARSSSKADPMPLEDGDRTERGGEGVV